ncbi:MAG: hypothetical protein K9G67_02955 [Bacteroidales bacterium]|nr:hypothetical protein [Bacteroidales bacterium]MCF8344389.1 hypothetical protein [Bacteroidales bacterium]MCF8350401.1 hypothetical protein [Bacteroidales bacterium]MCF8375288.1 hypothetical protein [Bacteroidales bacterium]MCF8400144.1 hypothetical protein [Bacteroidales bacterium]
MKNLIKFTLLTLAFAFVITGSSYADKPFEGIITYKISYPDSDFDAQTMAALPKVATMYVKGNFVKVKVNTGFGATQTIVNTEEMTGTVLMDMMGQKFAMKQSKEDFEKELNNIETEVEFLDESKEIAGYDCKKAIVKGSNKETGETFTYSVFYTEEIKSPGSNLTKPIFKDIPGMLMEYEIKNQGFTMFFTTSDVNKKRISDDEFEIPEGYTLTTEEELRSNFGM